MPAPENLEAQAAVCEQIDDCQSSEQDCLEEQAAADAAMQVQRWSLNQALAWIATRSAIAVGYNRSSDWVCIWARVNPAPYPFAGQGEAWSALGEAIVDGLQGLATKVLCYSDGRLPQEVLGASFPPEAQPGIVLSYRPSGGRDPVLSPIDRYSYVHWIEYRNLTFRREDVVSRFPALASIDDAEDGATIAIDPTAAAPGMSSAAAETRCRRWLTDKMREMPDQKRQSKEGYWQEAHAKFDVSNRAFERAWSQAVIDTGSAWNKAGRPKKNPGT